MSTDYLIKPVGAPVAAQIVRPAPEAVREAVPTQLPPDKTVTAAPGISHVNISPANYQQVDSDRISKGVIIDRDAGQMVYVSVDKKTNQIINQYPEETKLRTRAYLRAMDTAKQEARSFDRRMETDRNA
ncbi:hypothetical protein RPMA_20645 [Tardiphaga alba]|uniref:Flagellar protein FlaG n=1 Tax=Tardiphaga alba TaxID=340268 RepID=A0ABX8ABW3_9BRAD|nr:hypothetical protein [Tardiphaga alba]QUS40982.1 hypothetical protein RPMA_20645 [Tardiphaga alba]